MESLANKPFIICLKLPEDLYNHFESNSNCEGSLTLNTSSLKLTLSTDLKDDQITLSSDLNESESLFTFSVDSSKTPHLKGPIKYLGNLLKPVNKIVLDTNDSKIKPKIQVSDSNKENLNSLSFKLHKNHNVLLSGGTEESIKYEVMKRFGENRKRAPEQQIIDKLKPLFVEQKYWKIKSLSNSLVQPEGFIREIMKKIGEKVVKGEYRGLWTLKPNI